MTNKPHPSIKPTPLQEIRKQAGEVRKHQKKCRKEAIARYKKLGITMDYPEEPYNPLKNYLRALDALADKRVIELI